MLGVYLMFAFGLGMMMASVFLYQSSVTVRESLAEFEVKKHADQVQELDQSVESLKKAVVDGALSLDERLGAMQASYASLQVALNENCVAHTKEAKIMRDKMEYLEASQKELRAKVSGRDKVATFVQGMPKDIPVEVDVVYPEKILKNAKKKVRRK